MTKNVIDGLVNLIRGGCGMVNVLRKYLTV